ncbi:MAG: tRNA (adenosine(37)-N6)-threonylcarbamoyltransferase complex dimerization subunit type 1 TsaB [Candidatus Levybacteria bacterium]|nr:tRNA (adenosine(37)-N6)-threonylcarbamoyltransferase complex dimerization subunit type 1 TsaB [Candidatus Levybacteria bacterium]
MQNLVLSIDTSSNKHISVSLLVGEIENMNRQEIGQQKAQVVLSMIDALLKKNKKKLGDLTAIRVNSGPGSFTGLRVGVSIANTLGFALNIPINDKPVGTLVEPVYT